MTTSRATSFLSPILDFEAIPPDRLAYFRARLQDRFYEFVLTEFLALERSKKVSRTDLARRLDKDPSQITRLLAAPGNWTLDTVSDLLLAIFAAELDVSLTPLAVQIESVSSGTTDGTAEAPIVTSSKVHFLRSDFALAA